MKLTKAEAAGHLAVANQQLADTIAEVLVPALEAAGSTMPPGMIYKNYCDAAAKAVWPEMKRSDAALIAKKPAHEQAVFAMVKRGGAQRLRPWLDEAVEAGDPKPYKPVYRWFKEWAKHEVARLRLLDPDQVVEEVRP